MAKGILLTNDFDLAIHPIRDADGLIVSGLVLGDSQDQDAIVLLNLRQGELKEDPLLGVGLTKFIRGKHDKSAMENRIRQHFTRAGIDYDEYKERITYTINNENKL